MYRHIAYLLSLLAIFIITVALTDVAHSSGVSESTIFVLGIGLILVSIICRIRSQQC